MNTRYISIKPPRSTNEPCPLDPWNGYIPLYAFDMAKGWLYETNHNFVVCQISDHFGFVGIIDRETNSMREPNDKELQIALDWGLYLDCKE
jgi:hypothetical protein